MINIMSGAAALSAAKRRRGGQTNDDKPVVQSSGSSTTVRYTPIQLLQQHHSRIVELEKRGTSGMNHSDNVASFDERLSNLEDSINIPKQSESNEDLESLKQKIMLFENEFSTMKQTMMKIQNFPMETSMSLMKMQNGIKNDNQIIDNKEGERETVITSETPQQTPQEIQEQTSQETPLKENVEIVVSDVFDK